jgi:hypothetical protein
MKLVDVISDDEAKKLLFFFNEEHNGNTFAFSLQLCMIFITLSNVSSLLPEITLLFSLSMTSDLNLSTAATETL